MKKKNLKSFHKNTGEDKFFKTTLRSNKNYNIYRNKQSITVDYLGERLSAEDMEALHNYVIGCGVKTIYLSFKNIIPNDENFQIFIGSIFYSFEKIYNIKSKELEVIK